MAQLISKETLDFIKEQVYLDAYNGIPSEGKQLKYNHEECPAGRDTKKRLYAKVTEDSSKILCHCFNCGGSGVIRLRQVGLPSLHAIATVPDPVEAAKWEWAQTTYRLSVPVKAIATQDKLGWPLRWFMRNGEHVLMDNKDWYGIRKNGNTWITPLGSSSYEYRTTNKIFTRSTDPLHKTDSKVVIYNTGHSDTCVICEDTLSAMKMDLAGFSGVALCGSSLSADDTFKLIMRHKNFVVWLDNDNHEVRANAKAIFDRLRLYTDNASINTMDRDPKHYLINDLKKDIDIRLEEFKNNNKD